jgi:dihydrofolate reductase
MRKVIVGAFVSLDGVMQAPGGPEEDPTHGFRFGGWAAPLFDEEMGAAVGSVFGQPFDLLLGRKTYDIFAAHWPYVDADDPIGPLFDGLTKYVASRDQDFAPTWQNTKVIRGDLIEEVRGLKAGEGPALLTQGSTEVLDDLFTAGLVDELFVSFFPVILGQGKRLFQDGAKPSSVTLLESTRSSNGIVINRYAVGGDVKTGSFEFETPTDAELKRRRNLT